jgi:predicted dehydrogenase
MKLASMGINCLIEKPLASSSDQAREIEREFISRKLLGAVGHVERYNPALLELKRKIESGLVGDVIQVSTRRTGPFPGRIDDVGVVKDLASHDIDVVNYIDNDPAMRGQTYKGKPIVERPDNDAPIVIMAQGQRSLLVENIRKMGISNEIVQI